MPSPTPRFPRLTYKSAAVSGRRDHPRAATTLGTNTPTRRRRQHRNTLPRLPSTRRSRPSRTLPSDATQFTDSTRSSRAIYHATTASARAAEMTSHTLPIFQDENRERPSRSGTDIADVSRRAASGLFSDREEPRRVTRVVVKRRVIRGSPVFRPATEEELDDFLQVERFREMVTLPHTQVDIPPSADLPFCNAFDVERDVCAVCAAQLAAKKVISKRGLSRMSSLLSRGADDDEVVRISEMAAMDEYKAVALFLREIRRHRKDMFVSIQEKADRPDRKRKEKKKRILDDKDVKDLRRSASADDPVLMRAVERQERMIANAKKRMKDSQRRSRSEVVCKNEEWKQESAKSEEEDDLCDSLRILTAIEPVDPTEALDDDEVGRGESYRNEVHGRRRGLRMVGETGILGRLRSFRRKVQVAT